MRNILTIIAFSLITGILTALSACAVDKSPESKPAAAPDLLKGWTSETFALPPGFAPDLPTGHESLRFAPGWRDPKAPDFWSYAFVMWINEPAPDKARIKELLEKYYDGLLASFATGKQKDISGTPARVEIVRSGTNYFEVKLHAIDAFATFKPIELRVVIDCYSRTDDSSVLHIHVSPQLKEHPIWRSLEAAIANIVSQDGALQKKEDEKIVDPMAGFARLVGGEWKTTAQSGTSMFDTWHWGPNGRSVRVMTGGESAGGDPWREVRVMYWHPGRKQVRVLGLSPYAAGVSEGTIKFNGDSAEAFSDMYQSGNPPVHRKLSSRWKFDGPDKYNDALLEENGAAGYAPLASWDRVRIAPSATKQPRIAEKAPSLPGQLKVFEPLLGKTWDSRGRAKGNWETDQPFHIETTFEWVPLANAIYARTFMLRGNGTPIHLVDAYIYHHTGTGKLRCLALACPEAGRGRVYEGDVSVIEGGAIQLELQGYEGARVTPYVVRFDFENNGTLHQRVWSPDTAQQPMLDLHHTASEMSKNIMLVFQDRNNNYWFGSWLQGVYRYDGNAITHFTTKDGLADDRVNGIQEDKAGNIYFTTSSGISKFDGQTFTTLIPVKSVPPEKEWKLNPDDLWFPGSHGAGSVSRYDGKVLHGLDFPTTELGDAHYAEFPRSKYPNMKSTPYDVYSIFKDSKGNVWFGTATGFGLLGACRFDGKSFTWISSDEIGFGGIAYCVRSIAEDKDGKFWFSSTKHRFDVFPSGAAQEDTPRFKKENGVSHAEDDFPFFMSSTRDKNGDLWMASFGAGVWRYDGEKITQYPVLDDGMPVTLFSIFKDNRGVLWLGSHEAGALRFNGKTFEKFRP